MMNLPEKCPDCSSKKWKVYDSELKESVVDLDKGEHFPTGTLAQDIKCACCGYQDRNYQKTS